MTGFHCMKQRSLTILFPNPRRCIPVTIPVYLWRTCFFGQKGDWRNRPYVGAALDTFHSTSMTPGFVTAPDASDLYELWVRTTKNPVVSTALARSFARWLALLASHCSHGPLHSFVHSLAYSLTSQLVTKWMTHTHTHKHTHKHTHARAWEWIIDFIRS